MRKKNGNLLSCIKRDRYLYILLAPVILWYLVFCYGPMYGLLAAFERFSYSAGYFGSPWVGLENFRTVLANPGLINSLYNTLILSGLSIITGLVLPIAFALLVNEVFHNNFLRSVQTVTYLPHFISWVTMAGILGSVFAIDNGSINLVLQHFGFQQIDFYNDNRVFRWLLIITNNWKETGWSAIFYLAAIAGIDPTLYEAAYVDGASRLRCALHITLPALYGIAIFMFVMSFGGLLNYNFDQVYNLYQPGVYETADIIDTYIYRALANTTNISLPIAMGMMKAVVNMFLLLTVNYVARRKFGRGLY